jgi:hypothetical protein
MSRMINATMAAAIALSVAMTPQIASAHRLMPAGEAAKVARSDMAVTPAIQWNKISQRPGDKAERWTLDGELLNDVIFFGGVEDGTPLLREVNRRESPLPHFSSTMLPTDIAPLLESTLRITDHIVSFDVSRVAPATFLGASGVQFEYRMLGADDITRQGRAVGSIIDGKLYMITYAAPAEYFYARNLPDVDRIVASATRQSFRPAAPSNRRQGFFSAHSTSNNPASCSIIAPPSCSTSMIVTARL